MSIGIIIDIDDEEDDDWFDYDLDDYELDVLDDLWNTNDDDDD